jgi:hypothetical protein
VATGLVSAACVSTGLVSAAACFSSRQVAHRLAYRGLVSCL